MNKTKFLKRKKAAYLTMALLVGVFSANSCRNDDGNELPSVKENTYKITVTVPVVDGSDYVSIIASGGTANPQESDLWKINGTLQNGQKVVGVERQDFEGATKTYIIESAKPLMGLSASYSVLNSMQPITVSYKLEKNGETMINENFTLAAGESRNKDYSY